MITFEMQLSGDQIGRQLVNDPEELFYALKAIAEDMDESIGEDVSGYCWGVHEQIITLLKNLLSAMEGAA